MMGGQAAADSSPWARPEHQHQPSPHPDPAPPQQGRPGGLLIRGGRNGFGGGGSSGAATIWAPSTDHTASDSAPVGFSGGAAAFAAAAALDAWCATARRMPYAAAHLGEASVTRPARHLALLLALVLVAASRPHTPLLLPTGIRGSGHERNTICHD